MSQQRAMEQMDEMIFAQKISLIVEISERWQSGWTLSARRLANLSEFMFEVVVYTQNVCKYAVREK